MRSYINRNFCFPDLLQDFSCLRTQFRPVIHETLRLCLVTVALYDQNVMGQTRNRILNRVKVDSESSAFSVLDREFIEKIRQCNRETRAVSFPYPEAY